MTVTLERAATHTPAAGVIEEARGRQRRQRALMAAAILVGIVVSVLAFAWGGGNGGERSQAPGGPPSAGRGLAGRGDGSGSTQLISIVGVSLAVPHEWFGRTTIVWTGAGHSAWLQATNFPPQARINGEARIKAMQPGDLAVTICEECLPIQESVQRNRVRPLTLAGDAIPTARTPRGHLVLESSATIDGRLLTIDADFGSGVQHAVCCRW
jgi:hypothetical protein